MLPQAKIRWFYALLPYKASEAIFSLAFPLFLLSVLQVNVGTLGLLTALVSLTSVPGSILWGYLSDRLHRRRIFLVWGCIGSGVCLVGMGATPNLTLMALLCLVYGLFSIASATIPSALIMETMPQQHWDEAFGTFNKIGGWGWVVGLAIGGWLVPLLNYWLPGDFSLRVVFLLLAVTTLLTAWLAQRTITEPVHRRHRKHFISATHHLHALTVIERVLYLPRNLSFVLHPTQLARLGDYISKPYRVYLSATVLLFIGSTMVFTLLTPFLHDELQMHASLIFAMSLVRMLASTLCFEPVARREQQVGARRIQVWAFGARALIFLGFWSLWMLSQYVLQVGMLVSLNILAGITWSMLAVSAPVLVGYLTTDGQNGTGMGIYTAIKGLSMIVGALLGGYLAHGLGYAITFALAAGLALLGLLPLRRFAVPPSLTVT
jgi:MFS family permease